MCKRIMFAVFAAVLMVGAGNGVALFAQRGTRAQEIINVRLASPLPQQSPWGRTLDRVAAEWDRVTGGQVRLRVLHGGIEGGEDKMFLSLSSNNIQAAVFTSLGLSQIDPAILTVSAPFIIRNEDELDAVMNEIQGDLEARLNSGDYTLVSWSKVGFVNVFSREPVVTPNDLKRQKISSNSEVERMNFVFKTMGYQIVESDWTDVGTKVASGAITAIYQNPAAVAVSSLHRYMGNMLATGVAPFLGGIVINKATWNRIGSLNPQFQQDLLRVTRQISAELDTSMQRNVNDAVNAMIRDGLTVNRPSAAQEQLWYSDAERVVPSLIGTIYDRELYEKINAILIRRRAGR
ncbi:MAG: TRAP transporter substrate-binding protein DctP [Treponema sp.]|nr:TRAP transporter substrate-binding protein DctP [Treponema sp.]